MSDYVVPLPPRLVCADETFVPEPAVRIVDMRPDQVSAFVAMIDGMAEPASDLAAEFERLAGRLGARKDARQRLACAAAQEPL